LLEELGDMLNVNVLQLESSDQMRIPLRHLAKMFMESPRSMMFLRPPLILIRAWNPFDLIREEFGSILLKDKSELLEIMSQMRGGG
jgi:hypothetical protein